MCFENLPIAFDEAGRAHLDGGFDVGSQNGRSRTATATVTAPATAFGPRRPAPPTAGPGSFSYRIDPVTRVAGALAFEARVDLEERVVTEAYSEAVMFRGYELILKGRNPVEAIDISSRACGVCGGVHSTCASMALESVSGVTPPPLGMVARNLAEAAELVYDHCLSLFLLAGPDYSEAMVRRTNPALWARAERSLAPRATTHGRIKVADIMTGLNPLTGPLYLEALEVTRWGREIVSLVYGKYPHPSAVVPAGITTQLDHSTLNQVLARIVRLLDYAKRAAALWDDLVDFFYEADPRYRQVGVRRANLIVTGMWEDPEAYDALYEHADDWGSLRLSPPGVVVDGQVRTTKLRQVNLGIEEFVSHSFYDGWEGTDTPTAPDGAPLSQFHPWNKTTLPRPERRSWKERYSWATEPRWDREPMECGPLARQWVAATVGTVENQFVHGGSGALEITVPKGSLPEVALQWRVPQVVNAFERNRARAVHIGYCLMVAYSYLLSAFDYLRKGETAMSRPFKVSDGIGVGFWEAGRGTLTHHCVIEGGKLSNYQILTPSTWMASPRDPWDVPGPYEEAVLNTPILEEARSADDFAAVDILRAVRSFDPCLPCAVHVDAGRGAVVHDATTCLCGQDGAR